MKRFLFSFAILSASPAFPDSSACLVNAGGPVRNHIIASFGLPEYEYDVEAPQGAIEMCRDHYCALFNPDTQGPVWVVERLTPSVLAGDRGRPDEKWVLNHPNAAGLNNPVVDEDYEHSGFNRGHMAASDNFECSEDWMRQTFRFSNAVPQVGHGFNGWVWKHLERRVRDLAEARQEVFVITGPVHLPADGRSISISNQQNSCGHAIDLAEKTKLGKTQICDANDSNPNAPCDPGVSVPAGLFKVVFVPETGRIFGFLMSNEDHRRIDGSASTDRYIKRWQVSLDVIESLTSVELLPNFAARAKHIALHRCAQPRWR